MNDTKQKILLASLWLFNDRGISAVSLRTIADKVGISVGNLQYHFKKREDIIEALYFQLVKEIDSIIFINDDDLLKSFFNISTEMFTILYEYHFFLLDFVTIVRNNKKIKSHYAELSQHREKQFLETAEVMIEKGLFREASLEKEYHNLYKRTEVISNFWFSSILIQADVLSEEAIRQYELLVSQSIYPYLTEKAKNQYVNIFPRQQI
ncbi:MAG: hypothetical protein COA58_11510 [Bacteroidetes bacterium]|nr:MAG: hypothetical protein COA58_11510 [Bacteroidota bacterium]